jgi:hypothetical protein
MDGDNDPAGATTEVIGVPENSAQAAPAVAGEFRMDVLMIGLVIVGAIIVSNIWLRKRAERAESE